MATRLLELDRRLEDYVSITMSLRAKELRALCVYHNSASQKESLACQGFSECEAVVNEQIKMLNCNFVLPYGQRASQLELTPLSCDLSTFRDKLFKVSLEEERVHSGKLMEYQVADKNNDPQSADFIVV